MGPIAASSETLRGAAPPQRKEWPVYAKMSSSLVAWLDSEARRQRRSRAFVIVQAVEVLKTLRSTLDKEDAT